MFIATLFTCHDVEAAIMSINRGIDREDAAHTYSGVSLGRKREGIGSYAETAIRVKELGRSTTNMPICGI